MGLAAVGVAVGWAATGWPAAGVLAGAAAVVAPMLVGARRAREAVNERSEALAVWAEMLRDTIGAHAGLREAIALTAPVAPVPIRAEVQALAARSEREPLGRALRRFAAEVADPVADLIVAALVIAAERQAQRLSELLSQIAAAAREQSSMRLRVETGRARTYASSRALVVITFGLAVGLLLFSPAFMSPYDTAAGQLVLIGIGGLFTGGAGRSGVDVTSGRAPSAAGRRRTGSHGGVVMLVATAVAFGFAATGLLLIVRGVVGTTTPLAAIVAELHRPRIATGPSQRDRVVETLAGAGSPRRAADLAVCDRDLARWVTDRCRWALLGAAPGLLLLIFAAAGVLREVPVTTAAAAVVVGAVAGWWWARADLAADAGKARRAFRHALASYLQLVTILMAGGAGVETAMFDAAAVGTGPAFGQLRAALDHGAGPT